MSERPLQPPHIEGIRARDEDEAYDEARQRKLDEETARDEMRAKAETAAVVAAAKLLGVTGEDGLSTLRVLYQLAYMAGVLDTSREVLL